MSWSFLRLIAVAAVLMMAAVAFSLSAQAQNVSVLHTDKVGDCPDPVVTPNGAGGHGSAEGAGGDHNAKDRTSCPARNFHDTANPDIDHVGNCPHSFDALSGVNGHDDGPPPPPIKPSSSTPTHRQTSCKSCQKAADRLNKASDQLAQDLADPSAAHETIADGRSLVKDYSQMLDDCEKHCKDSGGLLDHVAIGVGVDVGGGHAHGDDHHSDHSDVP